MTCSSYKEQNGTQHEETDSIQSIMQILLRGQKIGFSFEMWIFT